MKKYDKRAKSETKEIYLSRQVEIQPCFNHSVLAELTDATTTNLSELEVLIDTTICATSSVVEPTSQFTGGSIDLEGELSNFMQSNDCVALQKVLDSTNDNTNDIPSRIFLRFCTTANLPILKLLAPFVDFNFTDDVNERSALHLLSVIGKMEIIKFICSHEKVDIGLIDVYGRQPIHYASMYGHAECVKFFIEHGSKKCNILSFFI